jgi:hypothetical protein
MIPPGFLGLAPPLSFGMPDTALRALLAGAVDYAGLFPPAGLPMAEAVANYAAYLGGPDAWALGRFVVPVARLDELERSAEPLAPEAPAPPWRLSALVGANPLEELRTLGEFNCRHAEVGAPALTADAVEVKAESVADVERILTAVPRWAEAYIEVPLAADPRPLIEAVARRGARAKMRTGGVTADVFPTAAQVLRFLRACAEARIPFKATAGLHHPLRADYPLTYAPDSPAGTMFGYLNVFLTALLLRQTHLPDQEALALLEERSPTAFLFTPDAAHWRGYRIDRQAIEAGRQEGIVAFGSCSFTEPLGELKGIGR